MATQVSSRTVTGLTCEDVVRDGAERGQLCGRAAVKVHVTPGQRRTPLCALHSSIEERRATPWGSVEDPSDTDLAAQLINKAQAGSVVVLRSATQRSAPGRSQ